MKKIILMLLTVSLMSGCSDAEIIATLKGESSPNMQMSSGNNNNNNSNTTVTELKEQSDEIPTVEFPNYKSGKNVGEPVLQEENTDIVITQSGTYEFVGNYQTLMVNVDKEVDSEAVYLILNNAHFSSETGTPIHIEEAKDVVFILEEGSFNTVNQGKIVTTDEDFPSGAIYSRADTVITGKGTLTVTTEYNDGINSRDDLVIIDANIVVNSIDDGIVGKDIVAINGANIEVITGNDGIKSTNADDADRGNVIIQSVNFLINAGGDCLVAEKCLQIDSGTFELTSGGGFTEVLNVITKGEGPGNTVQTTDTLEYSMKALKGYDIILNDGTFNISAYDDAINAKNNLVVSAGTYNIYTGDDGLTADNILNIYAGTINVFEGYEGIEAPYLSIYGGKIYVNVLDDAMNTNGVAGHMYIAGGDIHLVSNGDGVDSNHSFTMDGGNLVIDCNPMNTGGDSAIDIDGTIVIAGGTITDANGNAIDATVSTGGKGTRR
ncbi:MAG: carbohydrate-binding domain-containing protein [Clostridia bacterium]